MRPPELHTSPEQRSPLAQRSVDPIDLTRRVDAPSNPLRSSSVIEMSHNRHAAGSRAFVDCVTRRCEASHEMPIALAYTGPRAASWCTRAGFVRVNY